MPVFVRCSSCGAKIYLNVKRKSYLPIAFRLKCPVCGYEDVYTQKDAIEEGIYTFICPLCKLRFFIAREPPLTVECPHCGSILRIVSVHQAPIVIKPGLRNPLPIFATALLGALLGAAVSKDKPMGAVAGGLIGALVGAVLQGFSEPEAKYVEYVEE